MIVGKHAWQQEKDQKEDVGTALIFQEQLFTYELFKDTQGRSLIDPSLQEQCDNSVWITPTYLPHRMCFLIFIRSSTTD